MVEVHDGGLSDIMPVIYCVHRRDGMNLRLATVDDASLLLAWRNDPGTRATSHNAEVVALCEHNAWLEATLNNHHRQLYIAEVDGTPVGTVRADYDDESCELSWTVAPEARGKGFGKLMVSELAKRIDCVVRAEIKEGNIASVMIAQAAGMRMEYTKDGVMYWSRASTT